MSNKCKLAEAEATADHDNLAEDFTNVASQKPELGML